MNGTAVAQSPNIYFTIQAKLDAIAAVKRGERRMKVAHRLGITGDVLADWLATLAHHDWLNGTQKCAVSGSDILDRAVYTWYIQQLKADIHPSIEEVSKKADVFAMRLNKSPGHVNGAWVQKWLFRHDITLRDGTAPRVSETEIEEDEKEDQRLKDKRKIELKQTPEKRAIPTPKPIRKRPSFDKPDPSEKPRTYSRSTVPKMVVNGIPEKEEKVPAESKRPRTDSTESLKENIAFNSGDKAPKEENESSRVESKIICDFDLKTFIDGIIGKTLGSKTVELAPEFYDRVNDRLGCVEVQCKFVDSIYKRLGKFPTIYRSSGLFTQKVNRQAELKKKQILSSGKVKAPNANQKLDANHHLPAKNEIIFSGQNKLERRHLPPFGPVRRPELKVNALVYAAKGNSLSTWMLARVLDTKVGAQDGSTNPVYRVRFENKRNALVRLCPPKLMAYAEPPNVTLPVGTRIVARYKEDTGEYHTALYAGIIAEPPKVTNNLRYLVFFDDGYAQYVRHFEVFLVCSPKKEVWEDINHISREFIRQYLGQYPERPMVKLQRGQRVNTEWNGEWWQAVVNKVDASLVEMYFEADKRSEWIYRGSTRLEPLFRELIRVREIQESGKPTKRHNVNVKRKDRPYVEYTRSNDDDEDRPTSPEIEVIDYPNDFKKQQTARKNTGGEALRQVARKSTSQGGIIKNVGTFQPIPNRPRVLDPSKALSQMGDIETFKIEAKRITYLPHRCMNRCLGREDLKIHRGQNPLRIPMLCGWQREIVKFSIGCKRQVFYRTVCGRRLRNMDEVARYLKTTNSKLTMDLFTFDVEVHPFNQFKPSKICFFLKDITMGLEPVPVCCVNSLSQDGPPYLAYSATRFTAKGVTLNLDPEFLCGCDCVDDCQNRETCQCQQLTVSATSALLPEPNKNAGYKHRRLMDPLTTGIYECNSRCHCKKSCVNRVAQNGLQVRLQMFKTEQRGWGIRCLDDIPQGMFICIYAGQLLSEQEAIDQGQTFGDEYQAELDHIEVVETCKEGYEADVVDEDDFIDSSKTRDTMYKPTPGSRNSSDSDSDFELRNDANGYGSTGDKTISTRKRNGRSSSNEITGDSDSNNSNSATATKGVKTNGNPKEVKLSSSYGLASNRSSVKPDKEPRRSMRQTYFNEEYCYIMDAKNKGNIGRFLNHSCNPNVFVQNVFVDTHDLRFPWVAFFASCFIRAGKELTWDYNYEIGSVQGKVMWCYCGTSECRGRLL